MKKGFAIFWMLYILFFAVPFPMIMYYGINSEYDIQNLQYRDPWLAIVILDISILAWLILLAGYFKKWILRIFNTKRNIRYIRQHGVPRTAKILNAVKLKSKSAAYDHYDVNLSFKNLADTEVKEKISINDAKPVERRFEAGKTIELLLDPEVKRPPYFIFAASEANFKIARLILILTGWLLLLAAVIGYYIFSYQYESHGMGWRFIGFGHPLLICPVVLLFYRGLLWLIFSKFMGGRGDDAALIKLKGMRTSARLITANQTGTYINEQPMIRFELEYTDHLGQSHSSSVKKIVNLLDLNSTKAETVEIFYLKDDPKRIAFAKDLNQLN